MKQLRETFAPCHALLNRAEQAIFCGFKYKSWAEVVCVQALLAEGNSTLVCTLAELEELNRKTNKKH